MVRWNCVIGEGDCNGGDESSWGVEEKLMLAQWNDGGKLPRDGWNIGGKAVGVGTHVGSIG